MDCAARNRLSSLVMLLNRGPDPLVCNTGNETALHWVCRQDNVSLVEHLLDRARAKTDQSGFLKFVNQQPSPNKTGLINALIECAEHNHLKALNLLLQNKADYTLHGYLGNTPLLWASMKGYYHVVAALVKHAKLEDRESCSSKDFIDHQNRNGVNSLFQAAKRDYRRVVNLLLDEGIDWSITNKWGVSALHATSLVGNTEVVLALLTAAYAIADTKAFRQFLNGRNNDGKTALSDAADKRSSRDRERLVGEVQR